MCFYFWADQFGSHGQLAFGLLRAAVLWACFGRLPLSPQGLSLRIPQRLNFHLLIGFSALPTNELFHDTYRSKYLQPRTIKKGYQK